MSASPHDSLCIQLIDEQNNGDGFALGLVLCWRTVRGCTEIFSSAVTEYSSFLSIVITCLAIPLHQKPVDETIKVRSAFKLRRWDDNEHFYNPPIVDGTKEHKFQCDILDNFL